MVRFTITFPESTLNECTTQGFYPETQGFYPETSGIAAKQARVWNVRNSYIVVHFVNLRAQPRFEPIS